MIFAEDPKLKVSNYFKANMYLLSKSEGGRSKPIFGNYIQQLYSKTWNIACRVDLCKIIFNIIKIKIVNI